MTPHLRWQQVNRLAHSQRPSRDVFLWLRDRGSLTAKLIALSHGCFRVEVVRQVYAYPTLSERLALGMAQHQLALVREVVLYGNNEPWVFARSLLPITSLTGPLRHLRKQGNRPLGALLFSLPRLQRSVMVVACINRQHGYVPAEFMGEEPVWGRRSVFSIDDRGLLVSEVFLDSLTRVLNLSQKPKSTQ